MAPVGTLQSAADSTAALENSTAALENSIAALEKTIATLEKTTATIVFSAPFIAASTELKIKYNKLQGWLVPIPATLSASTSPLPAGGEGGGIYGTET